MHQNLELRKLGMHQNLELRKSGMHQNLELERRNASKSGTQESIKSTDGNHCSLAVFS
jgi:hypothetical protein